MKEQKDRTEKTVRKSIKNDRYGKKDEKRKERKTDRGPPKNNLQTINKDFINIFFNIFLVLLKKDDLQNDNRFLYLGQFEYMKACGKNYQDFFLQ